MFKEETRVSKTTPCAISKWRMFVPESISIHMNYNWDDYRPTCST
jgi:hypothetical protein